MFHRFHFSRKRPRGQGSITETELETLLEHVGKERILSPEEWLNRLRENRLKPSDLCLTFDDGLKSQFEVAVPILSKHNLKAFFFVFSSVFEGRIDRNEVYNCFATQRFETFEEFALAFFRAHPVSQDALESAGYREYAKATSSAHPFYTEADIRFRFVRNRMFDRATFERKMDEFISSQGDQVEEIAHALWMDEQELRELSHIGHTIGMHSYSHPFELSALSEASQREEYTRNHRHIARLTDAPARSMSHPLNSYNESTLRVLRELNVECGFRSTLAAPNGKAINPTHLEIAREDASNLLAELRKSKSPTRGKV